MVQPQLWTRQGCRVTVPVAQPIVAAPVIAPDGGGVDLMPARTGMEAVSRGGAVVVLRRVLTDPTLVPTMASMGE